MTGINELLYFSLTIVYHCNSQGLINKVLIIEIKQLGSATGSLINKF